MIDMNARKFHKDRLKARNHWWKCLVIYCQMPHATTWNLTPNCYNHSCSQRPHGVRRASYLVWAGTPSGCVWTAVWPLYYQPKAKIAIFIWLRCYSWPIYSFSYTTPTASEKLAKTTNPSKMCACRHRGRLPKIPPPKFIMEAMTHQKKNKNVNRWKPI